MRPRPGPPRASRCAPRGSRTRTACASELRPRLCRRARAGEHLLDHCRHRAPDARRLVGPVRVAHATAGIDREIGQAVQPELPLRNVDRRDERVVVEQFRITHARARLQVAVKRGLREEACALVEKPRKRRRRVDRSLERLATAGRRRTAASPRVRPGATVTLARRGRPGSRRTTRRNQRGLSVFGHEASARRMHLPV